MNIFIRLTMQDGNCYYSQTRIGLLIVFIDITTNIETGH